MKLRFSADAADLQRYLTQQATAFDEAADAAVIGATEELKQASRQQIGGRLSPRAGNLLASRYFKAQRAATGNIGTVGYTHSRWWRRSASGKRVDILAEYETGATIRAVKARSLAIPTKVAGSLGLGINGRRVRISPETFERRTGLKLRKITLPDGREFLVVDGARLNNRGVAVGFKGGPLTKRGRFKSGAATLFVFRLQPSTRLPKRLDLSQITERVQSSLGARVLAELARRDSAA